MSSHRREDGHRPRRKPPCYSRKMCVSDIGLGGEMIDNVHVDKLFVGGKELGGAAGDGLKMVRMWMWGSGLVTSDEAA